MRSKVKVTVTETRKLKFILVRSITIAKMQPEVRNFCHFFLWSVRRTVYFLKVIGRKVKVTDVIVQNNKNLNNIRKNEDRNIKLSSHIFIDLNLLMCQISRSYVERSMSQRSKRKLQRQFLAIFYLYRWRDRTRCRDLDLSPLCRWQWAMLSYRCKLFKTEPDCPAVYKTVYIGNSKRYRLIDWLIDSLFGV